MINYYIPDFFYLLKLNQYLIEKMRKSPEMFYPDIKIGAVYGTFPPAIWNGGRMVYGVCDYDNIQQIIEYFNGNNIPIRYTWTNNLLEKKHLLDSYCNMLMKIADNGFNEVLVNSPILEEHIRKFYPNYKLISSTTKNIKSIDLLNNELDKDYSLVVLDYTFNNKFDLLKDINNKNKIEILVNAICSTNCINRQRHYDTISYNQLNFRIAKLEESHCDIETDYSVIQKQEHYISYQDIIEKYVPLGFNHFKIEGRNNPEHIVMGQYVEYFVKPEYKHKFILDYFER